VRYNLGVRFLLIFIPLFLLSCFKRVNSIAVWERGATPTDKDIYDIFFISPDEGWACGKDGVLLHWSEGEWRETVNGDMEGYDLFCLFFLSSNEGWMGGGRQDEGVIFHYNGENWFIDYESIGGPIRSIHFSSPTDGWAAGRDSIYHFNGSSWIGVWGAPSSILSLSSIFSLPNSVWAIGEGTTNQILINFNGVVWNYDTIFTSLKLNSIYMTGEGEGWIAGEEGILYQIKGGAPYQVQSPLIADYYDIHFISEAEGWIVGMDENGDGTALHIISSNPFIQDEGLDEGGIFSVYFLSPSLGWVAGEGGRIFRYFKD
jgi:photosystem II stability/assembly factor-like uncharacterized protein